MNNTQLHEWQINFPEFLDRLKLSGRGFRNEMSLPDMRDLELVIPLKDIRNIRSVVAVPDALLIHMLSKITTLKGGFEPFCKSTFHPMRLDPKQLMIGQKFAYRENYVQLLEGISDIFRGKYVFNAGVINLCAIMVFGKDAEGKKAMAFYLPPIVECHTSGKLVVMDGIHRNYITRQMGATIEAIVVENVSVPFPCDPHPWEDLKVISLAEKPSEMNEKFFGLKMELFRDLKHFGIDG